MKTNANYFLITKQGGIYKLSYSSSSLLEVLETLSSLTNRIDDYIIIKGCTININ